MCTELQTLWCSSNAVPDFSCCKQAFCVSILPAPWRYICASVTQLGIACCCLQAPEHLQNFQAGGKLDTFDIEELVAEGSKGCAPLSPSLVHFTAIVGLHSLPAHCCICLAAAKLLTGQWRLCMALCTNHVQQAAVPRLAWGYFQPFALHSLAAM